jgi:hypothetical protein
MRPQFARMRRASQTHIGEYGAKTNAVCGSRQAPRNAAEAFADGRPPGRERAAIVREFSAPYRRQGKSSDDFAAGTPEP